MRTIDDLIEVRYGGIKYMRAIIHHTNHKTDFLTLTSYEDWDSEYNY